MQRCAQAHELDSTDDMSSGLVKITLVKYYLHNFRLPQANNYFTTDQILVYIFIQFFHSMVVLKG